MWFLKDIRFASWVDDGAKWDLKSEITEDGTPSYAAIVIGEWSLLFGTLRRYDDYGNISYGAFGSEAGYSPGELLDGSNQNQKGKDSAGITNGNGDEFRDKFTIKLGINLYKNGFLGKI